jgi:hypothetical protein
MRAHPGVCRFLSRFGGCTLVSFLLVLAACGGSSGAGSPTVVPPPVVSVSITSHPAGVNAGLSYRFIAAVQNSTNTSVTWAVSCACTGADIGAIAADGTYTAPASVAHQFLLTATATSVADTSKSASVQFTVMPPIQISMNAAPSQVALGFSHQFSASVENDLDARGVQWFVGDVAGGSAALGTIDSHGVYTAPTGSSEMIIAIVAKSVTDPSKTASATVTLIVNTHRNFTGDYIFNYSGPNGLGITAAAGTIHLDGAGRLTATLDINSNLNNNVLLPGVAVTGYYSFEHNNVAHATLNYTVGQQTASMSFRLALLNDVSARILEFDGIGDGTGVIEKKAGTGLNTSLDGPRVLALSGLNNTGQSNPQVSILGAFTGASGTLNGIFDAGSGFDQTPFTGTYSFGTTNTLTLNFQGWNNGTPVGFRVYPVSSDKAYVVSTGMPALAGIIEKQTGGPYSLPSFSGTWVFSTRAVDSTNHLAGVRLVRMQADGSGVNANGDMFDNNAYSVLDAPPYSVTFNRYYVAENGRGNANAQFAMPEPVVWYWVTPDRGYILSEGIGEFFRQQDGPFTSASLQGTMAILLQGYSEYFYHPEPDSQLGIGTFDGAGNLTLISSDLDVQDIADPLKMDVNRTGSYTISSDGRGLISLDNGQLVWRFLAVSKGKLLLMRPGYDVIGAGTAEQTAFPAE